MQNIKLTIAYDGSDFHGWQFQPKIPTIQGALEDALQKIPQERVAIHGVSRLCARQISAIRDRRDKVVLVHVCDSPSYISKARQMDSPVHMDATAPPPLPWAQEGAVRVPISVRQRRAYLLRLRWTVRVEYP